MMDHTDLVIIGGGPVAGVLAALLAPTQAQISIISPISTLPPTPGSRAIALNHSSRQILQSLNIWDSLADQAGQIRQIEVSRRGEPGRTHLSAADINSTELGWVVPESQLMAAITGKLDSLHELSRLSAVPEAIENQQDAISLQLDSTNSISTRLVIGADGAASPLRKLTALKFSQYDFHSVAICASVVSSQPHSNRAWERFANNGPIALLPLAEPNTYSLVWCVDAGDADDLLSCSESKFLSHLQNQFGDTAGRFVTAADRTAYPLIQSICRQPVADRLLLIGSAARHLHPVGGQGLNLALRDVVVLADLINLTNRQAGDPGNPALLQQYCDLRSNDWRTTDIFARRLPGLFAEHKPTLPLFRTLALTALELIPPLRRAFVRRAAGQLAFRPPGSA